MSLKTSALRLIAATALSLILADNIQAQTPGAVLTGIEISPPDLNLTSARARQSFIVQALYSDGITRDVTTESKFALANPALAKIDKSTLLPVADGATELKAEFGGKAATAKVSVKSASADRPVSFRLD